MLLLNPIGGLASQLHKYFVAFAITKKNNTTIKFYIEQDREEKDRVFELDKFNIDIQYATKWEILYFTKIQKRLNRLKRKLGMTNNIERFKGLMTYEYFNTVKNNTFLNGEWVLGDIYFRSFYPEIKDFFSLKQISSEAKSITKLISSSTCSVSIHFRRGDYLKKEISELHGNLTLDYYLNALQILKNHLPNTELELFIFSDDLDWVKRNFTTQCKTHYVNISSHEDIVLMSKCAHNIIANSGYSWLASYFNDNPNKIIVAPRQWVEDKEINEQIGLYTDTTHWIKL